MIMLAIGALLGSFIFSVSNYFIENKGGFLRKVALRSAFLRREVKKRESQRMSTRKSNRESLRKRKPSYGSHLPVSSSETRESSKLSSSVIGADDTTNLLDVDDGREASHPDRPSIRLVTEDDFTQEDHEEAAQIHQEFMEKADASVGVAIWLGILIDAFPESLVIGLLVVHGISYTFIAGVFVSNLPEAMSSTTIMLHGGFSRSRVLLMWVSIAIITGLGSVIGTAAFAGEFSEAKHMAELFVGGIAAGAMLVMIAETALPEAFRHAGRLVGFSTLFGFLTAYIIKLFEEVPMAPPP